MKQGKAKAIILIIIILLLIILGGCAYAYLATDIFKTPEELFTKYLANNIEQLKEFNLKPFDETIEKMVTDPADINADIVFTSDNPKTKGSANINIKSDPVNKKESFGIEVKNDEDYFFGIDAIITNEAFGLHLKEAHDKYITVENRDLKKLAKTLNLDEEMIEQIPDKIPETKAISDEDIETLKKLNDKYFKRLSEQIDASYYAVEKDVTVDVNGTEVKANKYTLTMSSKEFCTVILNTLDELFEDPEFTGLYEDDTQLNEVKEQIEEAKEELEDYDEDETVVIAVYENNKKTIKTEMTVDEDKVEFIISNNSIIVNVEDAYDDVSFIISNSFEGTQGELTIEYIDNEDNDNNTKIIIKSTKNNDDIESKIELDQEDVEEEDFKYDISFSVKFNPNLEIEELTDDNSIVINDYTEEDFTELLMEVVENLTKSAEEEPATLIGIIWGYTNSFATNANMNFSNLDSDTSNLNVDDSTPANREPRPFDEAVEIDEKKEKVESEIKTAIENKLLDYHMAAISNEDENPSDYLTVENIQAECDSEYQLEFIDGNTIKCTLDDEVYYAKIAIDGSEYKLTDIEVLYSEDGTLENAR